MNTTFRLCWLLAIALFASGAMCGDKSAPDIDGRPQRTPAQTLIDAAAGGDVTTIRQLLDAGTPLSSAMPVTGAQALHHAAANGHVSLVELLLARGASVNAEDVDGATPLVYAAYSGRVEVIKRLLAAGARVDHVPTRQVHALNAAMMSGSAATVTVLRDAGADPKQADSFGKTAVQYAAQINRPELLVALALDAETKP